MKKIFAWLDGHWWVVSLLSGIGVFVVTMLLSLGRSVWFDEGYSIYLAQQDLQSLLAFTAVDAHPPLYYIILKFWGELFGFSELALRSLSAIFAGLSVGLGLGLTKRLFGLRAGLMAIPVVVLAPFILRYGYEVRMYSLAALIGVAGTYSMILAMHTKKAIWWVLYAVLVALGMYTLYVSVVIWLAHLIWLAWHSSREEIPVRHWTWAWAYVGSVILFLPYMLTFFSQLLNSVLSGVGTEVTLTTLVDLFTIFFIFTPEWRVGGWESLVLGLVLVGLILATIIAFRRVEAEKRGYLYLYLGLIVVPMLVFAIMSLPPREAIFLPRYMAHVAVFVYLFIAVILSITVGSVRRRRVVYGLYMAVIFVFCYGVGVLTVGGNVIFEQIKTPMAKQISEQLQTRELRCSDQVTVVADEPYFYIDSFFYYQDCDLYYYLDRDNDRRGGYAPLKNSQQYQIREASEINSRYLVHLHGEIVYMDVDERYELVERIEMDKQFADIYKLSIQQNN